MKFLVLTNMYPKNGQYYRNAFIHQRVKQYIERGMEVSIFVLDPKCSEKNEYNFDGIRVVEGNHDDFVDYFQKFNPFKVLVHFINRHMIKALNNVPSPKRIIVWIHLMEAIGWYRRLFEISSKGFLRYIIANTIQIFNLRKFIKSIKNKDVHYIFVSEWIKNVMERDTFTKINNYKIIHNVVDTNYFTFKEKDPELRKRILLIKPFVSKKYANDIAVKAIEVLRKKNYFNDIHFTICGEGPLLSKTIKSIKGYSNVEIIDRFLTHNEIKELHDNHGIFLTPTRQDSQGVSMCEAMASGLVVISSNNSAIPEFVKDKETGLLTNSVKDIVESIGFIYNNPSEFNKISIQASKKIQEICCPELVIEQESELMKK